MQSELRTHLPKLTNPVSSDKTACPEDEVASVGEVQELNVLLHLHTNVVLNSHKLNKMYGRCLKRIPVKGHSLSEHA